MKKRCGKGFKEKIKCMFKSRSSAHEIALGFAVGTAIAIFPTFGLGLIIAFLVMLFYHRMNKVSLFLAFVFWNPFVLTITASLSFFIGSLIVNSSVFGDYSSLNYNIEFFNRVYSYTLNFIIGNLILTIFLTLISYFAVYYLVLIYHKKWKKNK